MDYLVSFGEWLRQRREALGLTRPELADCAGCSVSALRKIEADERRPSRQLAELLAGCLRIPPEEQPTFLDAARGARRVARLGHPTPHATRLPPISLPVPAAPLIGREAELATLIHLLGDPDCRLLTLVGLGGIGKTRLAIEAASNVWKRFADGVFFVSLAASNSYDFMVPAIAQAVRLNFSGPADPHRQLVKYLSNKQMLLLLDNLEHLLEGVEEIAALLAGAPGVKLLATSRERLGLQGETVFEVHELWVPAEGEVEALERYSAVQLFLQRARQARADFEPSVNEWPDIAHICRLVEGMPLAIELAATWTTLLNCQEIATEIERNLDFLATSMRDVPERQRSLRAVFDHSWQLLRPEERAALCRLAIFPGEFGRKAAEQVAQASLMMLMGLVSKSLVRRNALGRLDLHRLVRQYALARLQEMPDEETELKEHFCHYYADLMERWETRLKSQGALEVISEMSTEVDNLRQAWSWMIALAQAVNIVRSEFSLWWFHEMRGWIQESIQLMEQAASALREPGQGVGDAGGEIQLSAVLGRVLLRQSVSLMRCGTFDLAYQQLQECLELLKSGHDQATYATGLRQLGTIEFVWGNYDRALELMQESVNLCRSEGNPWDLSGSLLMLGDVLRVKGAFQAAYEASTESVKLARALGEPRMLAASLRYLGQITPLVGQTAEAERLLEESLEISGEIRDRWSQALTLSSLGEIALHAQDAARAEDYFQASLDLFQQIGDEAHQPDIKVFLGETLLAQGALDEAGDVFRAALGSASEMHLPSVALGAMSGIAAIWAEEGKIEAALELAIFTQQHPANYPEAVEKVSALVARLRSLMAPDQIEVVEMRAQARTLEGTAGELMAVQFDSGGRQSPGSPRRNESR